MLLANCPNSGTIHGKISYIMVSWKNAESYPGSRTAFLLQHLVYGKCVPLGEDKKREAIFLRLSGWPETI